MSQKLQDIKIIKRVEISQRLNIKSAEDYIRDHELSLLSLLIPRHPEKVRQILEKLSCKTNLDKVNLQTSG